MFCQTHLRHLGQAMSSNTAISTTTSALRGVNEYFMTACQLKVQGLRMRQTPGAWFWGGGIICWVSYQWACCPICVLQASSRRRDSLEFRHGRDRRVLREVHDDCRRLAQPRRVVLGASYGESFSRCPSELFQVFILKRARILFILLFDFVAGVTVVHALVCRFNPVLGGLLTPDAFSLLSLPRNGLLDGDSFSLLWRRLPFLGFCFGRRRTRGPHSYIR